MQQIPPDAQQKLVNFKQKVQDYLNKNKYHDEKIPPIKVQMQFSFTGLKYPHIIMKPNFSLPAREKFSIRLRIVAKKFGSVQIP